MRTRLLNLWERLHSTYWFIPSLMTLGAVGLSSLAISLDRRLETSTDMFFWAATISPDGAREIFGTVAGSMITVAGVVFSITIVALSLATTQFGPRLLRSFMRDRANQVVLGTFVATFVYCLLLLRVTHGENGGPAFVPSLGLAGGMILTLLSLGVFIYFIHHAADSIQAPTVAAIVGKELDAALEKLYPQCMGQKQPAQSHSMRPDEPSASIVSTKTGYLQAIDAHGLLQMAKCENVILEIVIRPGEFLIEGNQIARYWPAGKVTPDLVRKINCRIFAGRHRTPEQDAEFPVQQLVDMALRALSASNSDPHTAITCIHHLGAGLCKLAERAIPSPYRYDNEGNLRLIAEPLSFVSVAESAIRPLREHGSSEALFAEALFKTLAQVARRVNRPEDVEALRLHARELLNDTRQQLRQARDRETMNALFEELIQILQSNDTGAPTRDGTRASNAGA